MEIDEQLGRLMRALANQRGNGVCFFSRDAAKVGLAAEDIAALVAEGWLKEHLLFCDDVDGEIELDPADGEGGPEYGESYVTYHHPFTGRALKEDELLRSWLSTDKLDAVRPKPLGARDREAILRAALKEIVRCQVGAAQVAAKALLAAEEDILFLLGES